MMQPVQSLLTIRAGHIIFPTSFLLHKSSVLSTLDGDKKVTRRKLFCRVFPNGVYHIICAIFFNNSLPVMAFSKLFTLPTHLEVDHWKYFFLCRTIREKITPDMQRRYANFWKKSCLEAGLSSPVNVGIR